MRTFLGGGPGGPRPCRRTRDQSPPQAGGPRRPRKHAEHSFSVELTSRHCQGVGVEEAELLDHRRGACSTRAVDVRHRLKDAAVESEDVIVASAVGVPEERPRSALAGPAERAISSWNGVKKLRARFHSVHVPGQRSRWSLPLDQSSRGGRRRPRAERAFVPTHRSPTTDAELWMRPVAARPRPRLRDRNGQRRWPRVVPGPPGACVGGFQPSGPVQRAASGWKACRREAG